MWNDLPSRVTVHSKRENYPKFLSVFVFVSGMDEVFQRSKWSFQGSSLVFAGIRFHRVPDWPVFFIGGGWKPIFNRRSTLVRLCNVVHVPQVDQSSMGPWLGLREHLQETLYLMGIKNMVSGPLAPCTPQDHGSGHSVKNQVVVRKKWMVYCGIYATNWNEFTVVDISSRQLLIQNSG